MTSSAGLVRIVLLTVTVTVAACARTPAAPSDELDVVAGQYLRLVEELIHRDPDSASGDTATREHASDSDTQSRAVDQPRTSNQPHTFNPPRPFDDPRFNRPRASQQPRTLTDIAAEAGAAADNLRRSSTMPATAAVPRERDRFPERDEGDRAVARRAWLVAQLDAVAVRAAQQGGERIAFDQELLRLFGVARSVSSRPELSPIRNRLDRLLPGRGSAALRLAAFEERASVPAERLPQVFERALQECRSRTLSRTTLPQTERVTVEYVTGRPWSGFSTYAGQGRSTVAVNTAFPLTVDRVLQLACHEGYPGHHVLNTKRDQRQKAGRPELGAVPLFSPEAFASEEIAARAASLVFSDHERLAFERDVLFPLAGLTPSEAAAQLEVARLVEQLAPAIGDALSRYLAGERDYIETTWALQTDALMQHPQATLFFANQFRGFALAYTRAPVGHADAE